MLELPDATEIEEFVELELLHVTEIEGFVV